LEGDGFRAAILRPPMVYGKGCRGNYQTLAIWARRLPLFPNIEGARSVIYVEHLAELMRLIIEDGAAGVFCPQNAECASATILLREIARVHARRIAFTRAFNPLIRALGAQPLLRRAFGGLEYDRALSDYPRDYRVCGFSESIIRTEE
ncbi:MAG: NAD-dependent epimerase, partial [Christensenellales bacterium]